MIFMKNLAILGSTGSIGISTLDVVSRHPDRFRVVALAAGKNSRLLEAQIRRFRPQTVALADENAARELRARCREFPLEILGGMEGLIRVASHPDATLVVSAIVGAAGLVPTLSAIRAGKAVALANKETLVMAGELVVREAASHGATLIPVDSEHSAVFQALAGQRRDRVARVVLTASGGPFADLPLARLQAVTPQEALKHPNWKMGPKITVDSATLMNKGLEVMEAHWFFDLPAEQIHVLLHPQSIVHSLVEFVDGSVLAQMGVPDMRGPIAYALAYPDRLEGASPRLDLRTVGPLTFQEPDRERFPCLDLAYEALRMGGSMPAALNAANEVAVEAFLHERIGFMDIPRVVEAIMTRHRCTPIASLDHVLSVDRWARAEAQEQIKARVSA